MNLDHWNLRKGFVTATDMARILTGEWGGAYGVWLDKQPDSMPSEPSDAMLEGTLAEQFLLQFCPSGETQAWRTKGRLAATIDLLSSLGEPFDTKRVVRDVHSAKYEWGDEDTDEVPRYYLIQSQVQAYCADYGCGFLIADLAARGVTRFIVAHDRDLTAWMAEQASEWFERHVVAGEAPELTDETAITLHDRLASRAITPGKEIKLPAAQVKALIVMLEDARRAKALGEKIETLCKAKLHALAGDADKIVSGNKAVEWTTREVKRLDHGKLKAEHPDVYTQCLRIDVDKVLKTGGDDE